jgi:hypothetical protein
MAFDHVFKVMHYNLRNAMKVAQDFALWMDEEGQRPESSEGKQGLLEAYLALMDERYSQGNHSPVRCSVRGHHGQRPPMTRIVE